LKENVKLEVFFLLTASFSKGFSQLGGPSFHLKLEDHNGLERVWNRGVDFTKA